MFYASELYSLAPYTILHPHSLDQYYIHVTNSQRNIYPVHLFDHDGARLLIYSPSKHCKHEWPHNHDLNL